MDNDRRALRELERKHVRIKRKAAWEQRKKKLPRFILLFLLAAAAVAAVWLMTRPRPVMTDEKLCISVLDIGQGDAILVQTQTRNVLIDAGPPESSTHLLQLLRDHRVRQLDCIICSHPHSDHIGGVPAVLDTFPVKMLCLPQIPEALIPTGYTFDRILETAESKQISVRQPECGEIMLLGDDASLTFLCTDNSAFEELNDCSLCCRIQCGSQSFFCTGDLESAGENALLAAGLLTPVTVLKVGHHGSSSSTGDAFLAALEPQYAVISCGTGNDYGHPSEKTLRTLYNAGIPAYRTDIDGTVSFLTDGNDCRFVLANEIH